MSEFEYYPDASQLAVFHALTRAILEEMGEALRHGAFSQNIKERRDYSCALMDEEGNLVSAAAHIPVHLGSMDTACREVINSVKMTPGDAIILNDPYSGGTHLPDVTIIFPAFLSNPDNPDFFLAVRAHHADVGGKTPGSLPMSKCLDEEGYIIKPKHILRDGKPVDKVIDEFVSASRQPRERSGDLRAQLASGAVGLKRLAELSKVRGFDRMKIEASALINYSSRVLREFLQGKQPGNGIGKSQLDSVPGEPGAVIEVRVGLQHEPEILLTLDFSNSSDQHPGCLNATPAIVRSAVLYTLRLFLDPDTPSTSGLLNPVRIIIRKGSILDPEEGAAVAGGNVETSQALVEAILKGMQGLGWDVPASSQGTMNNVLIGSPEKDFETGYTLYETIGGGAGASSTGDGESAIHTHMTNTRNTPVEALERAFPIRIRRYCLREGSGGDGLHKGGNGIIREYEILEKSICTILSNHRTHGPDGVNGGLPGKPGCNVLIRGGENFIYLPARITLELEEGDILIIETPGGGGYGRK